MAAGLKELQPGLSSSRPEEVSRLNLQKFGGRVLEFSRRMARCEVWWPGKKFGSRVSRSLAAEFASAGS
ncbi:unnamed protein product [Prunus armeniaca]|uniref:Uncharacterized protein n=1 Tax=Prunus armeniaca TaxID=36596 RepID=A0A6J5UEF0_PRUAR|nr:unnamed protein product [Prunus armeniaca]